MKRLCCMVAFLCLGGVAIATAGSRVFLTEEELFGSMFAGGASVTADTVTISPTEAARLSDEFHIEILDSVYVFHTARLDGNVTRRVVIMNVVGQYQPITFAVEILPPGRVGRVELMVYRETRGGEIRRRAFLDQFSEKSLSDPIAIKQDVQHITGATLSSRAVSAGVRLALTLYQRLHSDAVADAGVNRGS